MHSKYGVLKARPDEMVQSSLASKLKCSEYKAMAKKIVTLPCKKFQRKTKCAQMCA